MGGADFLLILSTIGSLGLDLYFLNEDVCRYIVTVQLQSVSPCLLDFPSTLDPYPLNKAGQRSPDPKLTERI
jgi:hypothetical protein